MCIALLQGELQKSLQKTCYGANLDIHITGDMYKKKSWKFILSPSLNNLTWIPASCIFSKR